MNDTKASVGRGRGCSSVRQFFYLIAKSNYMEMNKMTISAWVNEALVKAALHSKIKLLGKSVKTLTQSTTTSPTLSCYKDAVVFPLIMFPKCSVFAQYSPRTFKQGPRREGSTSCLLRKFAFSELILTNMAKSSPRQNTRIGQSERRDGGARCWSDSSHICKITNFIGHQTQADHEVFKLTTSTTDDCDIMFTQRL